MELLSRLTSQWELSVIIFFEVIFQTEQFVNLFE